MPRLPCVQLVESSLMSSPPDFWNRLCHVHMPPWTPGSLHALLEHKLQSQGVGTIQVGDSQVSFHILLRRKQSSWEISRMHQTSSCTCLRQPSFSLLILMRLGYWWYRPPEAPHSQSHLLSPPHPKFSPSLLQKGTTSATEDMAVGGGSRGGRGGTCLLPESLTGSHLCCSQDETPAMAIVGPLQKISSSPNLDTCSRDLVWKSDLYGCNPVKMKSDRMWAGVLLQWKPSRRGRLCRKTGKCHPAVGGRTGTPAGQEVLGSEHQQQGGRGKSWSWP